MTYGNKLNEHTHFMINVLTFAKCVCLCVCTCVRVRVCTRACFWKITQKII